MFVRYIFLNGSLSNFKVFTGNSFEALDAELSSIHVNGICYLAIIPGGSGMLLGYKNDSRYQRQLRITYWDNKIYSRVKNNSTEWSEWVTIT